MSVYAKQNSRYYYYTVKLNGVRRTFSSKIENKPSNKFLVMKKKHEHQLRIDQKGSFALFTYNDLVERIIERYGRSDRRNLKFFMPYFKNRNLDTLKEDELNGLVDMHAKTRNNATTNRVFNTLRAALKIAKRELGWLQYVPEIKKLKETTRLAHILSNEEEIRLLSHAPKHMRLIIRFVLETGFRASTLVQLTWDMLDYDRKLIRIPAHLMKNKMPREINLNDEAFKILSMIEPCGIHPQIFKYRGRPLSKPATTAWQRARKLANLPNLRFHDLRHTWATRMRERGIQDHIIVQLGGWSDNQMLSFYAKQSKIDVSNVPGY